MKNSNFYFQSIFSLVIILAAANCYSQSEYEKRQKANKVENEHLENVYNNNLPNARPSTVKTYTPPASNSGGSSIYAADHQKKMDYYNNIEEQRKEAWEEKESKFRQLSANTPKNEQNYFKLITLAEQAGFDYYDAMRMNGRYKPKSITLPTLTPYKQEQFDAFKKQAEDFTEKKDYDGVIKSLHSAINLSPDLDLLSQLGNLYFYQIHNYEAAAANYELIHKSPVSDKPTIEQTYMNWGQVSILNGNYQKAAWCFLDLSNILNDMGSGSIYLSYAYFLMGNLQKANTSLLVNYTNSLSKDQTDLIKAYYFIKQGKLADGKKLIEKHKALIKLDFSGDDNKDLALLLLQHTDRATYSGDMTICYLFDIAVELDPNNSNIAGKRFDYNDHLKRKGFTDGMTEEAIAILKAEQPKREALKIVEEQKKKELEKANTGIFLLWFGSKNKPQYFIACQNIVQNKSVEDEIISNIKTFQVDKNFTYIDYKFFKGASQEDIYKEVEKKLNISMKKAKDKNYGRFYMLDK